MSNRSQKRVKGQGVDWKEMKDPHTINLTQTAWDLLGGKGRSHGISRSEVIERTVRGLVSWDSCDTED